MISADLTDIKKRATSWINNTQIKGQVIKSNSTIGGGSLPGEVLNTYVLAIEPETSTANKISAELRSYKTPIIARIESEQVLLDARTVLPTQDNIIIQALKEITT
tara:strand:- start:515 stop:829 length:315 start_codon:yes stop_codon:yes gene_type:complete